MSDLPAIGLGTWQNTDPAGCTESVRTALERGYRHVDTAHYYGNEEAIGEGIAAAKVPREEVFVATKVHVEKFGLAHEEMIEGLEVSLERLGQQAVDRDAGDPRLSVDVEHSEVRSNPCRRRCGLN